MTINRREIRCREASRLEIYNLVIGGDAYGPEYISDKRKFDIG